MGNKQINSEPTRIAYIIGKMWAGGVEAVVFNYYRAIDHTKFQFDFYYDADSTVEPPQDLIDMGARFIMLPPYQKLSAYLKELRHHLRTEHYTIVHSHLNTLSVFPLYAAWREHVPVRIAHNHSVPGGNELKRNLAKQVLRRLSKLFSTHYFACSEKAGRWMFGDKAFDDGKVYVLKNAVDFYRFHTSQSEVEDLKTQLGLSDCFIVGHIGRFTYAKNHEFLLDVFKEINERNSCARLLLVGDGELHDEIIKGIRNRGLENCVVMRGKVQNPEKYYKLNDVIILPSVFEGLSMTTVESQVAGVPAVISKAIPIEAIISDGCIYLDLNDSVKLWAEKAVNAANKEVHLNKSAEDYNIKTQAPKLEAWYFKALSHVRGGYSLK
ncbi:glycosyltransferase [Oribacterium sp. FC2011]|uniref:glycosyltransferase n=1 Tax=Oribacterium sp. FC2011 TaxID=1408311 RepID=UPI0004E0DB7E|nr:glycosyltransferase [Oribacterium sp. FC2011]